MKSDGGGSQDPADDQHDEFTGTQCHSGPLESSVETAEPVTSGERLARQGPWPTRRSPSAESVSPGPGPTVSSSASIDREPPEGPGPEGDGGEHDGERQEDGSDANQPGRACLEPRELDSAPGSRFGKWVGPGLTVRVLDRDRRTGSIAAGSAGNSITRRADATTTASTTTSTSSSARSNDSAVKTRR